MGSSDGSGVGKAMYDRVGVGVWDMDMDGETISDSVIVAVGAFVVHGLADCVGVDVWVTEDVGVMDEEAFGVYM